MIEATVASVNLKRLVNNYNKVRKFNKQKKILAVVKADAYGHGACEVSLELEKNSDKDLYFGVAAISEAISLRENNVKSPILLMGGARKYDFENVLNYKIIPVLYDIETIKSFDSYMNGRSVKYPIHIKVDTGMNRLGFTVEAFFNSIKKLKNLKNIYIEGIMSHMLDADKKSSKWNKIQYKNYKEILSELKLASIDPEFIHLENSSALFNFDFKETNMARVGIPLYGYSLLGETFDSELGLKPVLSVYSSVSRIHEAEKGAAVSYEAKKILAKKTKIATVPYGYADGYRRAYGEHTHMYIKNIKAKVLGLVTMDYTMIDVSSITSAKVGDKVVIMNDELNARVLAELSGVTIYEILLALKCRSGRRYTIN